MKLFKNILAFVLIVVIGAGLCSCGSNSNDIKTLTKKFENSCNKLDLNGMLDCIDPDVSNGVKALTGIIGMFSDKDTDELLDKFAKTLFKDLPENSKEFFSSIKIVLSDVKTEENAASASAEITYEISGEKYTITSVFEYVCIDGQWYISNLDA